ncbi:hypothetical protein MHU86_23782 [Fragilaria crotonensis]|nr:hypothetical protein MHU86_23782 [Fragilaria crotonensis]
MSDAGEIQYPNNRVLLTVDIEDCPLVEFPLCQLFDFATSTIVDDYLEVLQNYVTQVIEDTTWLDKQCMSRLLSTEFGVFHRVDDGSIYSSRQPALQRRIIRTLRSCGGSHRPLEIQLFIRFLLPDTHLPPCRTKFPVTIPDGIAAPGLHSSGAVVQADCESPSISSMLSPVKEDSDVALWAAFSVTVAPSSPDFVLFSNGENQAKHSDSHGIQHEAGGYIENPMTGTEVHDTSPMRAISHRTTIHAHFQRAGDDTTPPDGDIAQTQTSCVADAVSPHAVFAAGMQCLPSIWNVPVMSVRDVVATRACSGRTAIAAVDTTPNRGIAISLLILTAVLFLSPSLPTGGTWTADQAVVACLMFSKWLLMNRLLLPINMRFQPIDRGRHTMPMSVSSRFGQFVNTS